MHKGMEESLQMWTFLNKLSILQLGDYIFLRIQRVVATLVAKNHIIDDILALIFSSCIFFICGNYKLI